MGIFPKDRDLTEVPEEVELVVRASDLRQRIDEVNIRLDAFLQHHLSWRSRASIQRLIKEGYVLVDPVSPELPARPEGGSGRLAETRRSGMRLRHGFRVVVVMPEELRIPAQRLDHEELSILYEDDAVLAVDKPPFQPVHPSGRHLTGTLIQMVHARYRALGHEVDRKKAPIRLCHRLDRETSGVILVGKGERNHSRVMLQFENRQVEKEYLAIVRGHPAEDEGLMDLPIGPDRGGEIRLKMAITPKGLPSQTRWRVLERRIAGAYGPVALVSCLPKTGRQHQIRVHMDALGHPLVGDKLYGVDPSYFLRGAAGELDAADLRRLGLPRHALHAHRLAWTCPLTGEPRDVTAPLAPDLALFLGDVPTTSTPWTRLR